MSDSASQYTLNLFPTGNADSLIAQHGAAQSAGVNVTGVCFSGGGSRALSAAMGQLRGLTYLGLIEKTQFISGVSGGAWASTLYSFLPESISDDDFLGGVCLDPADLTWDADSSVSPACQLDTLTPNSLGAIPGGMSITSLLEDAVKMYDDGVPESEIWVRLVGKYIFQPFGLYSGFGTSKYFTWNKAWFDGLIAGNNPGLSLSDFLTYPGDRFRPSLFIYGSMIPHEKQADYELLPVMFSPFFCGVLSDFPGAGKNGADIGGGGIDPFGLNSTDHTSAGSNLQSVSVPAQRFSLADMAGISSSFFAEIIASRYSDFDSLIPEYPYWPVLNADSNPAITYGFADGGNLDNSGVASMARNPVKNIISFLNTSVPLSYDHELDVVIVDDQVPPLFGYQPYTPHHGYVSYLDPLLKPEYATYKDNHVFDSSRFDEYCITLWNAFVAGGTAMCFQQAVDKVPNAKYGVVNGKVNLLWVYNNPVKTWYDSLSDTVKAGMFIEPFLYGTFPNYSTADIGLVARQVNLLAHLSCWNVASDNTVGNPDGMTNAQMFQRMYSS